jgi:UDP-N-acetylglucosamine 2-epimerase
MKIMSVVGARPQFIKVAPISKALEKYGATQHILVHTGQHYDIELSKIFFDELSIPRPDYNLEVGSDSHARQTGRMIIGLEDTLLTEKPDLVLVYGDTNSTLAGALAAVKLHIPVAHVEAGPRIFDKSVPEEINRVLTDHIAGLLFAPTQTAVNNLKREGIKNGVYLAGDVMLDSFRHFSEIAERKSKIVDELALSQGGYLLATVHRARNTDNEKNLKSIIDAFINVGAKIVFPLHPRTEKYLKQYRLYEELKKAPNIKLISPVGYLDSMMLTRNASKVLTDSGGLQKEAYFSKVPCITLDEATCWPETVEDGWNILVGSDKDKIIQAAKDFEPKGKPRDVFGDGRAAEKIAGIVAEHRY